MDPLGHHFHSAIAFNNYFRVARHPCSNFDFLDSPLIRAQVDLKIKEP